MPVVTYKCPNCGGELTFDPETGRYQCEYCLSDFSPEDAERANPQAGEALREEETTEKPGVEQAAEEGRAVVYTCPSCGAEIVTDETTAATFCFYCHNPVVLTGRLSGEYLPDQVLPFAVSREQALERFLSYVKKKKFIPVDFFSKEQVKKMTGVYFPYWIYGGTFDGGYHARGRRIRTWRAGDIEYTETSIYQIEREGTAEMEGLSRNALQKADKDLIECVQPYQLGAMKPFSMGYLSGFQAEKRDLEQASLEKDLLAERDRMMKSALRNTASSYASLEGEQVRVRPVSELWQYVLLPVWTLTYTGRDGKIYYYAMNGQTGKINGDFPVNRRKAALTAAICALLVFALMMVGGYFL